MGTYTNTVQAELKGISIAEKVQTNKNITGSNVGIYADCQQALRDVY